MQETRPSWSQRSAGGAGARRPREQAPDDWLGDIADDDWNEKPAGSAERRGTAPADEQRSDAEGDAWLDRTAERRPPPAPGADADAPPGVIERRRIVAGLALVVIVGLAAGLAVLLLRGGDEEPVTAVPEAVTTTTTPGPVETAPSATETTPSTTTPTTTTPTPNESAFVLPEGTKLQRPEGDDAAANEPDQALVEALQRALTAAGYDPGAADGNFGQQTEAAVIAFQQANGLTADGIVGPETASALSTAVADG